MDRPGGGKQGFEALQMGHGYVMGCYRSLAYVAHPAPLTPDLRVGVKHQHVRRAADPQYRSVVLGMVWFR